MIQIAVQGYLTLHGSLGKRRVSVDLGTDLQTILTSLQADLTDRFEWLPDSAPGQGFENLVVLLNGRSVKSLPAGLNTILKEGDHIAIFPPLAGG